MVFLAYDKVPFSQYEAYLAYHGLTPGDDARMVALDVLRSAPRDNVVWALTDEMNERKVALGFVAQEFFLFAILDGEGEAFDVYLLDEDSLFVGCATGVAQEDVVRTGERLMVAESLSGAGWSGPSSADIGVPLFEQVEGQMVVWGDRVTVSRVGVYPNGTEIVVPELTNANQVRVAVGLHPKVTEWLIGVGKGGKVFQMRPTDMLRFTVDGETVDLTREMAEKFVLARAATAE